jgi:hypothetical protein
MRLCEAGFVCWARWSDVCCLILQIYVHVEKKDDSLSLSLGGAWRGTLSGSSVDASTRFTCMTSWASSKDLCFTHTKHSIVPGWPYRAAMLTT